VYDIPFTSVTSFVLLMSSLTMVLALAAIQRGDLRRLRIWLFATAALGAVFISGQVFEFTEFSRKGLDLGTNLFGTTFFVLTGFHGAHVSIGIIWLLSLWGIATQGRLQQADAEKVEIAGLYWHFVDVVWIFLYTVVYLL
jgi:cytochrome c oxidase subunit 3/cytochrome o ubiquinol oxidase subunit 3